jgi:predicted DNA-binding protein with PD1-like motif
MRARRNGREHVLAFDPEERAIEVLTGYAREQGITAARFSAIGGFKWVELKYFNMRSMRYQQRQLEEQLEVIALTGNLSLYENAPFIHAHVIVGTADFGAYSGHLGEAVVEPTLELFLTQLDEPLLRTRNPRTGLGELRPEQQP